MTDFNTYELSTMDSAAIELFKFECIDYSSGSELVRRYWYYTNYHTAVSYGGNTYEAMQISHSPTNVSQNPDDSQITVEISSLSKIITDNVINYADENIRLTIYKQQNFESDYTQEVFTGWVIQIKINHLTSEIACDPGLSTSRKPLLYIIYSTQCPVPLYSRACGVSKDAYTKDAIVIGTSGKTIYFSGDETDNSGYYKAGIVTTSDGQSRTIQSHHGNRIEVVRPFRDLNAGDTISLSRGCDHTVTTCADIFNNIENFRGCPFMPNRSPFAGSGVEA